MFGSPKRPFEMSTANEDSREQTRSLTPKTGPALGETALQQDSRSSSKRSPTQTPRSRKKSWIRSTNSLRSCTTTETGWQGCRAVYRLISRNSYLHTELHLCQSLKSSMSDFKQRELVWRHIHL